MQSFTALLVLPHRLPLSMCIFHPMIPVFLPWYPYDSWFTPVFVRLVLLCSFHAYSNNSCFSYESLCILAFPRFFHSSSMVHLYFSWLFTFLFCLFTAASRIVLLCVSWHSSYSVLVFPAIVLIRLRRSIVQLHCPWVFPFRYCFFTSTPQISAPVFLGIALIVLLCFLP